MRLVSSKPQLLPGPVSLPVALLRLATLVRVNNLDFVHVRAYPPLQRKIVDPQWVYANIKICKRHS